MLRSAELFSVRHARHDGSDQDLLDSFRLRYELYCLEERFLPVEDYPDGYERDAYDALSEHTVVREKSSGRMAGCARLIQYSSELGFPTAHHFPELYGKLSGVPLAETYEASRLCISQAFRHRMAPKDGLYGIESYLEEDNAYRAKVQSERRANPIVLILMIRAMYRLTLSLRGRFWIASMEPGLIRYLDKCGWECTRLADHPVDFYGNVIPCLFDLEKAIIRLSEKRPDIHEFFVSATMDEA